MLDEEIPSSFCSCIHPSLTVSRLRNLGVRSTQRAESLNRAFKRTLRTGCPLMDLFHALLKMSKSLEETRAFMSFQALDKPELYPEPISHLAGVVSKYILDLLKGEYAKSKRISIEGETTEGLWVFSDGHRFSSRNGCNCTFFAQYFALCAHALKIGLPSLVEEQFHPCWSVGDAPITPPAINMDRSQNHRSPKRTSNRRRLRPWQQVFMQGLMTCQPQRALYSPRNLSKCWTKVM